MKIALYLIVAMLLVSIGSAARDIGTTYRSANTVINELKNLQAKYPSLMSYEVIGKDMSGKSIYLFKVGNPEGAEFLFDGRIHGPEDCGTETGVKFIKWALTSTSQDAKDVLSKNRLLFIPIINDRTTRQNARRNYYLEDGKVVYVPYGVDLNRNYNFRWYESGSSNPKDSYAYRGHWANSEPETKAVINALDKYHPKAYMNVHCGEEMLRGLYKSSTSAAYGYVTKALSKISEIAHNTYASTMSIYEPGKRSGCGGTYYAGYASAYGCNSFNAAGWLFEISTWAHMPDTLTDYNNKWYKQAFPVYLGIAISIR